MKQRLLFFFLLCSALTLATASAGLLDGTEWQVQVVPTKETANKEAPEARRFDDVLTFAKGKLVSQELKGKKVGAVRYSATGNPDFYNWTTAPVLRGKNKAQWDGVIKGATLKGNLKWTTRDGRVLYFFVNGKKR
ncbi:MAG: hypothetical protein ABIR71_10030 [Chthoniobacterales bacterium]